MRILYFTLATLLTTVIIAKAEWHAVPHISDRVAIMSSAEISGTAVYYECKKADEKITAIFSTYYLNRANDNYTSPAYINLKWREVLESVVSIGKPIKLSNGILAYRFDLTPEQSKFALEHLTKHRMDFKLVSEDLSDKIVGRVYVSNFHNAILLKEYCSIK